MSGGQGTYIDVTEATLRSMMAREVHRAGYVRPGTIPEHMGFRDWCEDLGERGLKVDQKPFRLSDRPALIPIYDAIPTTRAEAAGRGLTIQKATQLGLTVWEVLADIYMALKWSPLNVGLFLPDMAIAAFKSERRFMPLIRSSPELYRHLTVRREITGDETRVGEGNVLTRAVGDSLLMFLWTSGRASTESRPMDVVSLDEVQEMTLDQIEKVLARLGDSDVAFRMMLSTPNMPELDINYWYHRGTQEVWHTRCDTCGVLSDLSDPAGIFPGKSIAYNTGQVAPAPRALSGGPPADPPRDEYVWCCPNCQHHVLDPQHGEYVLQNPGADPKMRSFLLPRTISPRMTPRAMMEGWNRAAAGPLRANFYRRTLARPYIDPDQQPVSLGHCEACVEEGRRAGVVWETAGQGYYLGLDQMDNFICAIVKKRLPDGRQAVVHVEAIFSADPWAGCDRLMKAYGVAVCVVETLPDTNGARAFANRFRGRVYLAGYADLRDDMMIWGDDLTKSDRRTAEEDRSRYTVTLQQYKAMQKSLYAVRDRLCLFPDPALLEQQWRFHGADERTLILRDHVFLHLTRTALVVEEDPETLKRKPRVKKIGLDPHFALANMLCDVAWARNNGVTMMILPDQSGPPSAAAGAMAERVEAAMPGLPASVVGMIADLPQDVCGRCANFADGRCMARDLATTADAPACVIYEPLPD